MENDLLRIVTPEDYPTLKAWWEGADWPPVPQRLLPPLGVICGDKAAGWLYMDNGGTGIAMLAWLVTNPDVEDAHADEALLIVVEFLKSEAKRMAYPVIMTSFRERKMAGLLNRAGFETTETEMTHMLGVFN